MIDAILKLGDCLKRIQEIPENSIDLVLADPPFGITANKWDSIIPFGKLWIELDRVVKPTTPVVFSCFQPFTTELIQSNRKAFKYLWIWDKRPRVTGFLNANKQPLRASEDIAVFYYKQCTYNPQKTKGKLVRIHARGTSDRNYGKHKRTKYESDTRYPTNIISVKRDNRLDVGSFHSTQKPVALLEYLIKTYSNEGDIVLDFCMGSGTTVNAAINLNRKFIGIEKEISYFCKAVNRIELKTR
jgi:site-specific DNA-methyltransferase (adenine-specific)